MLPPDFRLVPMTAADYTEALALWSSCEGVRANETPDEFKRVLRRNRGLSCVIRRNKELAAAVLCCHDGRRGYLYHVCVAAAYRQLGLGRVLVDYSLAKLHEAGISHCSIFVHVRNQAGEAFWKHVGWQERIDIKVLAHDF